MSDLISIYRDNRADFYRTVRARIPHPRLRDLLDTIPADPEPAVEAFPEQPADWSADSFLAALQLRDLLKKPGFGLILGRTTISFAEALSRAEQVEATGLILFEQLSAHAAGSSPTFAAAVQRHQAALGEVLHLADALRYHRLQL